MTVLSRYVTAALASGGLLVGLAACGSGADTDHAATAADQSASAAACRVLAVTHGPITSVEADMADETFDNAQSATFTAAIATATTLVGQNGVSNDLAAPLAALTAAWATSGTGVAEGIQASVQRQNLRADRAAWDGMVSACAPYADIG